MKIALNCGSGQRPFKSTGDVNWINIDSQERWNPDICCNAEHLPYDDGTVDYVVLHHILEHFTLTGGETLIQETNRVLKPGGSLLVFIPNLRALAERWLANQIDDYIFFVNTYGAFMSHQDDLHKWAYTEKTLTSHLQHHGRWQKICPFDWREIPGSSLARDWWVLAMEAVKASDG